MQQMINKIPPKSVHFDNTVHAWFGVNTLRLYYYTGICELVSPTPLEPLLEDGGSLPASKRVRGTQARLWIEGGMGASISAIPEVGFGTFGISQMVVDLLANG